MSKVIVHIDRVVLRGFGDADRRPVSEALRDHLTGKFADASTLSMLTRASPLPQFPLEAFHAPGGLKRK